MKFESVSLVTANGWILAHTLRWKDGVLRKGVVLNEDNIRILREAGFREIVAAKIESGDISEDVAAARVAKLLVPDRLASGIEIGKAAKGRVNLFAAGEGVLRARRGAVDALNAIDESVTIASLADYARVSQRQMVATVKIIPYAVDAEIMSRVATALANEEPALQVHPVKVKSSELILTSRPEFSTGRTAKGEKAVCDRLHALGIADVEVRTVAHDIGELSVAIGDSKAELILVLGDTVTTDRNDVAPAAVMAAGGEILRCGMPVDPGNLLVLASLGRRPVLVLPGCVRSPKLNGADWVLTRVACGLEVTSGDIAGMGVGGLLHEIPSRRQPRMGGTVRPGRPKVAALLLAAGLSRRMGDDNKLLRKIGDTALIAEVCREVGKSSVDEIIVVTGLQSDQVRAALEATNLSKLRFAHNPAYEEGMGASIRTGMANLQADAVVIVLGDMPGIGAVQIDRLIDAYDPGAGHAICRTVGPDAQPGHPILFGARFFESLLALKGDRGARAVVAENLSEAVDLPVTTKAIVDLDTPEDFLKWKGETE